jgi:sphingomyelin phosphodiesterase acid-like 3
MLSAEKIGDRIGTLNSGRAQLVYLQTLVCSIFPSSATVQSSEAPSNTFLIVSAFISIPWLTPPWSPILTQPIPRSQWETILERSKLNRFSQYGEDTNWWLLSWALAEMRATLPHPAFIMVPGDLLAHDFPASYAAVTHDNDREHYRAFVLKTLDFLELEFRKRFGDAKILVTPGDNDEECGDNSMEAHGRFLNDTAELARDSAEADRSFKKEWKALGIYNVPHPVVRGPWCAHNFAERSIFLVPISTLQFQPGL